MTLRVYKRFDVETFEDIGPLLKNLEELELLDEAKFDTIRDGETGAAMSMSVVVYFRNVYPVSHGGTPAE